MIQNNLLARSEGTRSCRLGSSHLISILILVLTLGGCSSDEAPLSAAGPGGPGGTTPPGTTPPGTTPPPVDPNPTIPPPPLTDVAAFEATLFPMVRDPANFCVGCHGAAQIPTFAVADSTAAYNVIMSQQKVDLANPDLSRVYLRPATDRHNCGGDAVCDTIAAAFLLGIQDWAAQRPAPPPASLLSSLKTTLADGQAGSAVRSEANVIAHFDFDEGSGDVTVDTSGVGAAITLNITNMEWVAGGLRNVNGKAQADATDSQKLTDMISGPYSIEAWLIPENTAQVGPARIVSYSVDTATRNFTLGQESIYYNFRNRTAASDANGSPGLEAVVQDVAVELQHVVATFDPAVGRKIYVNGQLSVEEDLPTTLDWQPNNLLVLANETTDDRPWAGTLQMVAIHNAALTPVEVTQNFSAGIGEYVTLQFDVSDILGNPGTVDMQVTQLDDASYVFAQPTFNSAASGIQVTNIRVSVNDVVPVAAQSFRRVDVMADGGTLLSPLGAIIPVALGPTMDQFHLEFEALGGQMGTAEPIAPSSPPLPLADVPEPDVGVRSFSKINDTMSALTGIGTNNGTISALYDQVRDSLPATDDVLAFVSANQVATQRMAVAYCGEIVANNNTCDGFFGVNNCAIVNGDKGTIADTVFDKLIGVNLANQPDRTLATTELVAVMDDLCPGGCTGATADEALQATCAATLSSAAVAIN